MSNNQQLRVYRKKRVRAQNDNVLIESNKGRDKWDTWVTDQGGVSSFVDTGKQLESRLNKHTWDSVQLE